MCGKLVELPRVLPEVIEEQRCAALAAIIELRLRCERDCEPYCKILVDIELHYPKPIVWMNE